MKIRERLRWRPTGAGIAIFLLFVWEIFLQPIWNLNIERVAEQERIDGTLRDSLPLIGGVVVPNVIIEWVNYLTGPFLTGFVIAAAIFGLGPNVGTVAKLGMAYVRQWRATPVNRTLTSGEPRHNEREVIPHGLRVWGILTDDRVDIEPQIIYRNRSSIDLVIKPTRAFYALENKEPPGKTSSGFSRDLNREKNYSINFTPIRIHSLQKNPTGLVQIEFLYGPKGGEYNTVVAISYSFTVLSMPTKPKRKEKLKIDFVENVNYEDI